MQRQLFHMERTVKSKICFSSFPCSNICTSLCARFLYIEQSRKWQLCPTAPIFVIMREEIHVALKTNVWRGALNVYTLFAEKHTVVLVNGDSASAENLGGGR